MDKKLFLINSHTNLDLNILSITNNTYNRHLLSLHCKSFTPIVGTDIDEDLMNFFETHYHQENKNNDFNKYLHIFVCIIDMQQKILNVHCYRHFYKTIKTIIEQNEEYPTCIKLLNKKINNEQNDILQYMNSMLNDDKEIKLKNPNKETPNRIFIYT